MVTVNSKKIDQFKDRPIGFWDPPIWNIVSIDKIDPGGTPWLASRFTSKSVADSSVDILNSRHLLQGRREGHICTCLPVAHRSKAGPAGIGLAIDQGRLCDITGDKFT